MSRRRSLSTDTKRTRPRGRDISKAYAITRLRDRDKLPLPVVFIAKRIKKSLLREIEDRREWRPHISSARPRTTGGLRATIGEESTRQKPFTRGLPKFEDPRKVLICARRKARKEVLFSSGRAGKGKRVARRPRKRGPYSGVKC